MRLAVVILMMFCVVACVPSPASTAGVTGTLEVSVVAGPVCPVETQELDPACEPRPVRGAPLVVSPGDGTEIVVAQDTSDAGGFATFELAPGTYIVTGAEVAGLFGVPDPAVVEILAGEAASLTLGYDTGIR